MTRTKTPQYVQYRIWIKITGWSTWAMCTPCTDSREDALERAHDMAAMENVDGVQITGTDQTTYAPVYARIVK